MQSIDDKIVARIYGSGRGWAFSKNDFLDLSGDAVIRKTLSRLEQKGTIRRLLRGLYDYPKYSELLARAAGPELDQAAQGLARKFGWRIQPSGNTALNYLGLSTQIPAQTMYLSDGPSRAYTIGNRKLVFKKRALKESGFKHRDSEMLVQALKELGRDRVDDTIRKKLMEAIPASMWPKIVKDTKSATAWVHEVIRGIAEDVAQ